MGLRFALPCILPALVVLAPVFAYASVPDDLAKDVAGVVGSGDQLQLKLKAGEATRILEVGGEYAEGWRLMSLTPSEVILVKDGTIQKIGLNPTGAIAQAKGDEPPTTVKTVGGNGQVTVEQIAARQPAFNKLLAEQLGPWDGKTPRMGLTLAETQRYVEYQTRGAIYPDRFSQAPGPGPKGANGFLSVTQVIEGLGSGADDYLALNQKMLDSLNAERGYTPYLGEPRTLNPPPENAVPIPEAQLRAGRQGALEALLTTVPGRIITPPGGP